MYDPEAVYQDADIEQAEMIRLGNRLDRLERQGICTHGHTIGYLRPAFYYVQEHLEPGERICTGCGTVFASDEDWHIALINL